MTLLLWLIINKDDDYVGNQVDSPMLFLNFLRSSTADPNTRKSSPRKQKVEHLTTQ